MSNTTPNGMGDVQDHWVDPPDHSHDTIDSGYSRPTAGFRKVFDEKKAKPKWPQIQQGPKGEVQKIIRHEVFPQLEWLIKHELPQQLQKGIYFQKRESWLEPPSRARCLDVFQNPAGSTSTLVTPGGTSTVLTFSVPDRMIGVIRNFGHAVDTAAAWPFLTWRILKNGRPVDCYSDWTGMQLGELMNPYQFAKPIFLKWRDTITLEVTNNDTECNHTAFGRFDGWTIPVETASQDTIFGKWLVV